MTPEVDYHNERLNRRTTDRFWIGLALSGGGFRASIFHLGVIRRLEELGIMKDVDVLSCVSGGSIVGAYYACEMERRLRAYPPKQWRETVTRMEVFEGIARDFLQAVDHNLRTRALVYTPFYHPIAFLKTLLLSAFRSGARSELIQREYDRWFYDGDTVDQLPSVQPRAAHAQPPGPSVPILTGPKVILNTTSLLTGERVSFSREPNSGMAGMRRSNRNSLPLARVVGASSGVPVLFPPTPIYGDLLVDGGVADNQGFEALLDERTYKPVDDSLHPILLVSDASGQMEAVHRMKTGATDVFFRVNSVLQFQVRSKLIDRLVQWQTDEPHRFFAFTHLYMNIKDRGIDARLPAELIPATARLRTDLDQFSPCERDALMYHGYTLMNAQIADYCVPLTTAYPWAPLSAPPLFS